MNKGHSHSKYRPLWIAAVAIIALPFLMRVLGLSVNTASMVIILAIATMALNLCVGYTGLVSFGHSTWFGIGAYAAGLIQLHWFHNQIWLPILLSMVAVAVLSTAAGMLILRRRGVYFSLLTLALSALTYTVSFRWTEVTGGEDGLSGLKRGTIGPIFLDDGLAFYIVVALIGLGVLYLLLRVVRSPFGHVLVAIRENQLRATFQGYAIDRYKLAVFVLSAVVTGVAGALLGFQTYLVSAEAVSVPFSGELLAMVVIGGMHHILGPALGALFFILFRELFSIWTQNWLLWFGLIFVCFVLFSPSGLVGIWTTIRRRWSPPPEKAAAMSKRKIYEGLPLPAFLRPVAAQGTVLEVRRCVQTFRRHSCRFGREPFAWLRRNPRLDRSQWRRKDHLIQSGVGSVSVRTRERYGLGGQDIHGLPVQTICQRGLTRSFQITSLFRTSSIAENIRLSLQARHPAQFNIWRDVDSYDDINAETAELIRFLGLEGIEDHPGRRTLVWRTAAGRPRHRARLETAGSVARRAARRACSGRARARVDLIRMSLKPSPS